MEVDGVSLLPGLELDYHLVCEGEAILQVLFDPGCLENEFLQLRLELTLKSFRSEPKVLVLSLSRLHWRVLLCIRVYVLI